LVYGIALRILNDTADAEEVTLDVYAQIWKSAATFDVQRGSVCSWMVTLVRSRAIDRMRSRHSRVRREEAASIELRAASPGPEEQTVFFEKTKRIQAALATLSREQRQAIELAFFSGLTHVEVATKVGEPLGTIKTRIRLGMMRLRDALGDFA
jgi:RNA polymerase sigma-70 factor (ECF subfamily)